MGNNVYSITLIIKKCINHLLIFVLSFDINAIDASMIGKPYPNKRNAL